MLQTLQFIEIALQNINMLLHDLALEGRTNRFACTAGIERILNNVFPQYMYSMQE